MAGEQPQPQPDPIERPDRAPWWWPDWPLLRPHSTWPWPDNPKYPLPHMPGHEGWDRDPWMA